MSYKATEQELHQFSQGCIREDEDYFRCTKLNCTLERSVCGKRYLRGTGIVLSTKDDRGVAKDIQSYMVCRNCSVGKSHSQLVQLSPSKIKTVRLGHAMRQLDS